MEWYKILIRFTMETYDVSVDRAPDGPADAGEETDAPDRMRYPLYRSIMSRADWERSTTLGHMSSEAQITVSGCTHTNVGPIVRGNYILSGSNHDKPAYKKEQQVSGLDVMLYYWDERDGVAFSGWWFGPKIGGDQVWAYQPTRANQTPPRSGWKVPYDGPVDNSLCLAPKGGAMSPRQDAEAKRRGPLWGGPFALQRSPCSA
eukprot:g1232.t1